VISQQTENSPIIVKVNLTNVGEHAFGVRVSINFTTPLSWIQVCLLCKEWHLITIIRRSTFIKPFHSLYSPYVFRRSR